MIYPFIHSIFTLLLIKQIFKKNKSSRAASESQMQFWPRITPDICICVSMYICMHVHICVYIFCTFVYLYLLVYNLFKRGYFNIFLIYFELGKDVCIFLHSFILWQIDTYWLALSTFKRNSDIYWRLPCWLGYSRKKSKQGQSPKTGGHFWKNPGILGLFIYCWKLWIPEKKRVHPRKFCKIVVHSFFCLEIPTRPKTKTHGNCAWFFLISWSPLDTTLLF